MLYPSLQFKFFADELEKISALSGGQLAGLTAALGTGTVLGAVGKDMYQDAREGRVLRRQREDAQRATLQQPVQMPLPSFGGHL